jgi:hypothetical protein
MIANPGSEVEKMIFDYIEQRQLSLHHHKRKTDAEKEYNKLLANSGGEEKIFSLDQANKIYKAYQEILTNEQQSKQAEDRYNQSYENLKELGRILFYANITAEITMPSLNGGGPVAKQVTVSFPNGEVFVA